MDLTGKFPTTTQSGNKYVLVAYDYDSNAILSILVPNCSDPVITKAITAIYEYLTDKVFKQSLNVLNNEASTAIKQCIMKTGAKYQLMEPNNHCVSATERAICTFKEHFIIGLCTTDENCPLWQWDELIAQAVITLKLLCMSRSNPCLFLYAYLNGQFNYNKTPLAPPCTRALIDDDPDSRLSWESHEVEGWYVGPAMEHYRCYWFHIPSTSGHCVTEMVDFFPQHCTMPVFSSAATATAAANDLIEVLKHPAPTAPFAPLSANHLNTIKQLEDIFNAATKQ
eukprot:15362027-Ditylum_brightwellii.AAC.1